MKLRDARDIYFARTAKASDIVRQLAFAGIAIIWIFRIEVENGSAIPADLLLPGFLIVVTLTFDLLQYVVAGALWGHFHRAKERIGWDSDAEFKAPRAINWPALGFYWAKIICVVMAYILLGSSLYRSMEFT